MSLNLMLRTEYSFLNSLCSLEKTINYAKELGYKSLGIADIGNLHGGYKFFCACKKAEIKPIMGIQINVNYNEQDYPILIYAMDNFGYQNVMRLASYYKINNNHVDFDYLVKNNLGVVVVTVPQDYFYENINNAFLKVMKETFSDFFVGVSKGMLENSYDNLNTLLNELSIKQVAVNETCYLKKEDREAFLVLKSIKENKPLKELSFDECDYHFMSNDEFQNTFKDYPYLIQNTTLIENKCNVEIKNNGLQLPLYQEGLDTANYLKAISYKGLQKRLGVVSDIYLKRLEKELNIINQMGFNDYFLIVFDYVRFAKKNDILVGPGRGSAAGSLVSYSLGITDIDPIKYQLLFERFLNPERISMPDIDIDFPDNQRETVIKYVGERYGANKVAHIATFGTFACRSAIKDVAKALSLSTIRTEEILKYCTDQKKSLAQTFAETPELQKLANDYQDIKKTIDIALQIEGLPRNVSTHAAGIIITKYDLVNYTPLDNGLNGIYQTQYEAKDLEDLGLLKMDFLGLRNLTIIKNCMDMIKQSEPDFRLPTSFNDRETLKMIALGDTTGVFQLESGGMRQTLKQMQVNSFEDICSALALYRPGPMDMIPTYIKRKLGQEPVQYLHKDLESILKPTFGVIIYQEQIMLIACKFAGYTLGEADVLRRAVSKKKRDVLAKEKVKFVESSIKNGYTKEIAEEIYEYIYKFADYGFNKSHSVAYAMVAYYIAYLKCHYPNHYFGTLLNSVIGTNNLISEYVTEINHRHLKVLPPNINLSTNQFQVINGAILMPLTQIDGIGQAYYDEFIKVRTEPFNSFEDFVIRCSNVFPASVMENLIYAGALDCFKLPKKAMIDNYGQIISRNKYSFVKNITSIEFQEGEFSYGYLLNKEKEVLGVNLKYSFMYQYEGYYRRHQAIHIDQIKEGNVVILGAVTSIREITTKNDKKMFFASVKDETGTINLTIFSNRYLDFKEVRVGMVLLIDGVAERRNNEMQVILNQFKQI